MGPTRRFTWNTLDERQFPVRISHQNVENIVGGPAVMEEELQTLGAGFGVKPATLQERLVAGRSRGWAEVHEEAFTWWRTEVSVGAAVSGV